MGSRHSSTWAWHLRCWGDWLHHPKERLYPESASKTPGPGHGLHQALHRGCVQPAQLCRLHPVPPLAARRAGPGPCPPRGSPAGVTHSHGPVQREEATSRRSMVRGAQGQGPHSPRQPWLLASSQAGATRFPGVPVPAGLPQICPQHQGTDASTPGLGCLGSGMAVTFTSVSQAGLKPLGGSAGGIAGFEEHP